MDTQNGEEATQQEQQAGRNSYLEHASHGRRRARVPGTDGLVEGGGTLQQCIQGRMAVSSERRDIQGIHKTVRRQRSRSNRRAETRTSNIELMSVTELVSQSPMGWLKAEGPYSCTSRDEWPGPVSVETSRGYTKR